MSSNKFNIPDLPSGRSAFSSHSGKKKSPFQQQQRDLDSVEITENKHLELKPDSPINIKKGPDPEPNPNIDQINESLDDSNDMSSEDKSYANVKVNEPNDEQVVQGILKKEFGDSDTNTKAVMAYMEQQFNNKITRIASELSESLKHSVIQAITTGHHGVPRGSQSTAVNSLQDNKDFEKMKNVSKNVSNFENHTTTFNHSEQANFDNINVGTSAYTTGHVRSNSVPPTYRNEVELGNEIMTPKSLPLEVQQQTFNGNFQTQHHNDQHHIRNSNQTLVPTQIPQNSQHTSTSNKQQTNKNKNTQHQTIQSSNNAQTPTVPSYVQAQRPSQNNTYNSSNIQTNNLPPQHQAKVTKTTTVMTHTTDAELHGSFNGVRRLLPIRRLLEFMGFPAPLPTPLYIDNAAVDAVIDANRLTPRCRHLDIPIAFLQQEKGKSYEQFLIRTQQMLADFGTKPLVTLLHKRFKYWVTGASYLPLPETLHYNLLKMCFYEKCFVDIIKELREMASTTNADQ